ncbi:MAG: hypothetical protein GIKADHBN_01056 [Phycisphaerales bacterium]|nr:hypothetical protein [Phycisphaerales bacterium]
MWNKVVEHIVACELAANIDAPVVARYCEAWSNWKRAEEFLHAHGETYTVRSLISGQPMVVQWPQAAHALRLATELSRLERVLGIGPFMRRRVKVNARPGTPHAHPTAFERAYCLGGPEATRKRLERQARGEWLKQTKLGEAATALREGSSVKVRNDQNVTPIGRSARGLALVERAVVDGRRSCVSMCAHSGRGSPQEGPSRC